MSGETLEVPPEILEVLEAEFQRVSDELDDMKNLKAEVDTLKAERDRIVALIKEKLELLERRKILERQQTKLDTFLVEHNPEHDDDDDDHDWGDDDEEPTQVPEVAKQLPTSPNVQKLEKASNDAPQYNFEGWVLRLSVGSRKQAGAILRALTGKKTLHQTPKTMPQVFAFSHLNATLLQPKPSLLVIRSNDQMLATLKILIEGLPSMLSDVGYTIKDARVMPENCAVCISCRVVRNKEDYCRRHIEPTVGCPSYHKASSVFLPSAHLKLPSTSR